MTIVHAKMAKASIALITAALLSVILLSVCFIAMEAVHDCSGEDCPVCLLIALCEQNIQKVKAVLILIVISVFSTRQDAKVHFPQNVFPRCVSQLYLSPLTHKSPDCIQDRQ